MEEYDSQRATWAQAREKPLTFVNSVDADDHHQLMLLLFPSLICMS